MALDNKQLPDITSIAVPDYPRGELTCGIVHFGVGGFHRAHEAMYLDRLISADPGSRTWAICGVGVLPSDARMRDALVPQDGLYTLTLKHPDGTVETSVIGSIAQYLYAPDDPEAVIAKMAAPETHIVSLTVTEGGYNFSPTTGAFDTSNPAVVADLEPDAVPATTFGLVTAALERRRAQGLPSFTVMSCDNIQGNGDIARATFTAFAELKDPELASWMSENTCFPNSMVDRITPATAPELLVEVEDRTGVADRWPVVAEPFTQWVLEDSFSDGRPALETVGVQVVSDVGPYELMKLRLLNASHQGLCYFGYLMGYRYVHDAAQDPLLRALLRGYMNNEARPTLLPAPGVDVEEYMETLIERFSNPAIGDTIARLCQDSSDRIPKWLVPVIKSQLATGGDVELAAAVVASWTRYAEGEDENGDPIDVVDPLADVLVPLAKKSRNDPLAFVGNTDLFGDLAEDDRFTRPYLSALESLRGRGARETLSRLTAAGQGTRE
ncbi:mannitol dehydrogenase family protein [Gordonia rubripertincta]|uniref:Mannitol dehydrogenase family protein n=1 Tax=Gordonia rubripertincta TaxID=36822 RepID=A0ABT4MQ74_GORRU|nr:mannitol dehydrogenase family protein [Gordonia rubripertincta]MCZ4549139.1 mannitol dehydrogenase family protein [Gordonia rubripertincta]